MSDGAFSEDDYHVIFWRRADGLACLARKRPARLGLTKRWEVHVLQGDRVVKAERFETFRRAYRAARTNYRIDFAVPERQTTP